MAASELDDGLKTGDYGLAAITAQSGMDWQACVRGLMAVSPRLGSWAQAAAGQMRAALAAICASCTPARLTAALTSHRLAAREAWPPA
jgi:hypothetical protein